MKEEFNPFSLSGKTIIVTGASSGIGQQCAIDFSRMGADVVAIARNKERLDKTVSCLSEGNHLAVIADLTEFELIPELVESIIAKIGKIDGLVNCAGISTTLPIKLMNEAKLDEFFKANVYTAIELTREVSKVKNMNPGGSIIFFSSIMGCVGEKGKSLYSMTKGALISGTRSLACEYAKRRIRVNSISPGAIITPINENLPHISDPVQREMLEQKHLLGLGQTSDISAACIYLLSEASRWVTGQNFIVDGGYTAR